MHDTACGEGDEVPPQIPPGEIDEKGESLETQSPVVRSIQKRRANNRRIVIAKINVRWEMGRVIRKVRQKTK